MLEIVGQMWHDIVAYLRKKKLFLVGTHLKLGLKNESDFILSPQDVTREYNLRISRMAKLSNVRCRLLACPDGL